MVVRVEGEGDAITGIAGHPNAGEVLLDGLIQGRHQVIGLQRCFTLLRVFDWRHALAGSQPQINKVLGQPGLYQVLAQGWHVQRLLAVLCRIELAAIRGAVSQHIEFVLVCQVLQWRVGEQLWIQVGRGIEYAGLL